jgi:hypothetical protein
MHMIAARLFAALRVTKKVKWRSKVTKVTRGYSSLNTRVICIWLSAEVA